MSNRCILVVWGGREGRGGEGRGGGMFGSVTSCACAGVTRMDRRCRLLECFEQKGIKSL